MTQKVPASQTAENLTATAQASAIASAVAAGNVKLTGDVVQVGYASSAAMSTVTTTIPFDDTIPQNTEGTEFLTVTLTPAASTNNLHIEALVHVSGSLTSGYIMAALFQDSGANAVCADGITYTGAGFINTLKISARIAAGTTSATTIRLRMGPGSASTVTLNGSSGARLFGGVYTSSLTVTEIKA